jgi:Fe-S cluster assembly protein SufD
LLVFVDGCFRASLSRLGAGNGIGLASLRERLAGAPASLEPWIGRFLPLAGHGFTALNTAFLDDGAVIEIADGAIAEAPVHVVYLSTARQRPFVAHPRNLIVAGAGSSALVVEHYVGEAGARHLTNAVSEIALARGAALGHVRVQDESHAAFHVARVQVEQAEDSCFFSHAFGFGAALSRTEIAVKLAGEEAECNLAGLYAVDGSRHVDHHLMVDHARPRTRSRQLYKGVLEDSSRGVFTGRVVVRAGSQKIKATQSNASLLLGRGAVAETRPQLEIYADDVVCNHGATIGRLSDDALFYLLSRGIDPREARRILVSGFAAEVVDGVAEQALRSALTETVAARIGELGRGSLARAGAVS